MARSETQSSVYPTNYPFGQWFHTTVPHWTSYDPHDHQLNTPSASSSSSINSNSCLNDDPRSTPIKLRKSQADSLDGSMGLVVTYEPTIRPTHGGCRLRFMTMRTGGYVRTDRLLHKNGPVVRKTDRYVHNSLDVATPSSSPQSMNTVRSIICSDGWHLRFPLPSMKAYLLDHYLFCRNK